MTSHTNRNGLSFNYEYDSSNRCIHAYGDGGIHDYRFSYLDHENTTVSTDSFDSSTIRCYDSNNLLLSQTDPLGTTNYQYNSQFLLAAVNDPLGRMTSFEYNESGDLTTLTRPDGNRIEITYDENSHPLTITDPCGGVSKLEWSKEGLLLSRTTSGWAKTSYEYDSWGSLTAVIDPVGARTLYGLDSSGALAHITAPLGSKTSIGRDSLGNILSITAPNGAKTHYQYDASSRLISVIRPSGAEIHLSYDMQGNLTSYRDEMGRKTRFEYTGIREVSRRINPNGTEVRFNYDSKGRMISLTNERGETFRLKRDKAGRVTEQTDYWGNITLYEWDPAGRLTKRTNPLGDQTLYEYDPLDRIIERVFPSDDTIETFTYDANGNLLMHENPFSTVRRTFDVEGLLKREEQGNVTIEYLHDAQGRCIKRTSSLGNTVEYAYDPGGNVSEITINGVRAVSIERNSLGLPKKEALANHITRNYTYDIEGRLIREELLGTEWVKEYRYDVSGKLTGRRDPNSGESRFTYDSMGQLRTSKDSVSGFKEYLYDVAGNLPEETRKEKGIRTLQYEDTLYRFDASGHLIESKGEEGKTSLVWGEGGRLFECWIKGRKTMMAYDALGRRIGKLTGTKRTDFIWEGARLLSDRCEGEEREFVYYPGSFIPFAAIVRGKVYYYYNDVSGLPREVRNEEGTILWEAQYDAWGNLIKLKDHHIFNNPIRMQGHYYDQETGLHYNYHRYYDPRMGGYISADPIGLAGGINLYAYCLNDPVNFVDPLGLWKAQGHTDLTADAANLITNAAGFPQFTQADINNMALTNINVDRLSNQTNDAAHYMPGTHDHAHDIIYNLLDRAVELENNGRHEDAIDALGEGLHTLQDRFAHFEQNAGWLQHVTGNPDCPTAHPSEYRNALNASVYYLRQFAARTRR